MANHTSSPSWQEGPAVLKCCARNVLRTPPAAREGSESERSARFPGEGNPHRFPCSAPSLAYA
ncbi:hypothetical protein RISK_001101 [Rhodopirellula islandica]|uniref:Uncharacterized protein n=1 Tax=Rhodopirellula islandica TaxID=595434 RepID=A0A0J1BJU3_RHOIS|nr:hypothetical protein RISK_001101 [Rhodopirellula islandica]